MSKFDLTLRKIYQNILTSTHQKILINEAKIKNIDEIYKNIIPIKYANQNFLKIFKQETNDEIFKEFGIIIQDLISYNLSIINKIYAANNFDQITPIELLNSTNNYFKYIYGNKIINNLPIYICKFNFSYPKFWLNILDEFSINYEKNQQEHFKLNFKNNDGLTVPIGNAIILCLNTNINIQTNTIFHQLFHCLQLIMNLKINLNIIDLNNYLNGIFQLGLSQQNIQYLLNPKQFQTYIQIDFNNILEAIYTEFYTNKTDINTFKFNVLNDLKNNINNIFLSMFYKKFLQSKIIQNKDNTAIKCFALCLYLDDKSYLKEALNILLK